MFKTLEERPEDWTRLTCSSLQFPQGWTAWDTEQYRLRCVDEGQRKVGVTAIRVTLTRS